ncbi:glycosyltransferase family 4 protein [Solicola sp. PLA-1-18]|uniref:glycosyltransferase family 4 protein n=1 Tax=Solicola sp. PLA-1-18 TaxID=3380532 RepID=UPI003B7E9129
MRAVAFPRDTNPYQDLLHGALAHEGVRVDYLPMPTPSRTLNLLLMPAVLAVLRLRGVRVLHLHWVFDFEIGGTDRVPALRRVAQAWFGVVLRWSQLIGVRVVWTAHNILPHTQVFHDDRAARATLLRTASHVLVHDAFVTGELAQLVAPDALPPVSVVPHGPFDEHYDVDVDRVAARARVGIALDRRVLAFVGRVTQEKGVDLLLEAFTQLVDDVRDAGERPPLLVVAGRCDDPALVGRLHDTARAVGGDLHLDLRFLPDADLADLVAGADVLVLPFRKVTTSGSALLAMGFAKPVVVPDLPPFADVPDDAVLRFAAGDAKDLRETLLEATTLTPGDLGRRGAVAQEWAGRATWPDAARSTARAYRDAVAGGRRR